jgi:hypothetical protein
MELLEGIKKKDNEEGEGRGKDRKHGEEEEKTITREDLMK